MWESHLHRYEQELTGSLVKRLNTGRGRARYRCLFSTRSLIEVSSRIVQRISIFFFVSIEMLLHHNLKCTFHSLECHHWPLVDISATPRLWVPCVSHHLSLVLFECPSSTSSVAMSYSPFYAYFLPPLPLPFSAPSSSPIMQWFKTGKQARYWWC